MYILYTNLLECNKNNYDCAHKSKTINVFVSKRIQLFRIFIIVVRFFIVPVYIPVYPSQRFNYQTVIMRHEQYGLHGTLPHFASRNRNVELLIIQRANVPALRSLIAIDRSELQLGRAQLEAQALESIFGFRQKK